MYQHFECRKCAADYVPEPGNSGVCDRCFDELEIAGYSLDEIFDAYPEHEELNHDVDEEDDNIIVGDD